LSTPKLKALIFLYALAWLSPTLAQKSAPKSVDSVHSQVLPQIPAQEQQRYALFWSQGNTWVADTIQGVLFRSPTLIAQGPNGHILEYKLNLHTKRLKSQRPYGELYRWVSLDRYLLGGQHVDELTNHFRIDELTQETHDEHQIFQFTGEFITLVRWFYHKQTERSHTESTSIYSLALDGVEPLPKMSRAEQLLDFTRRLYPKLIPKCLDAESRLVRWELSGQRPIFWLMLSPSERGNCPSGLSALRVNPPPKPNVSHELVWKDQTLFYKGESLYGGVVDALIHPNGKVALTLEGAPRYDEKLFVKRVNHLFEKGSRRYLSFWRAFENGRVTTGRHLSFNDEADIQRLDGARWIANNHPILELLSTHFQPVDQPSCFKALKVKRLDKYRRPKRTPSFGHLCAVETTGRVWEGHDDLSASIVAQIIDQTLYLDIWVTDPDRTHGDQIKLWVGSKLRPIEMTITSKGVIGREAIKAGVKLNWWEREAKRQKRNSKAGSDYDRMKGYQVHLQLPLSFTQGSLSLSIEDVDIALPSAHQRLWLVGHPNSNAIGVEDGISPARFEVP
jgi:hypothetical protein